MLGEFGGYSGRRGVKKQLSIYLSVWAPRICSHRRALNLKTVSTRPAYCDFSFKSGGEKTKAKAKLVRKTGYPINLQKMIFNGLCWCHSMQQCHKQHNPTVSGCGSGTITPEVGRIGLTIVDKLVRYSSTYICVTLSKLQSQLLCFRPPPPHPLPPRLTVVIDKVSYQCGVCGHTTA